MSVEERLKLLSTTAFTGVASIALLAAMPASAQDADDVDEIEEIAEEEEAEDRVVVTGSRIRRDSFSSTAPLQVIDGANIQDAGLVSLEEVLVQNPVFTGTQLDLQFNDNFVSDAGPGGAAANLRGLGADRTLTLINGRRFAPAGIEGAPAFPDISLIPVSMISSIDILLDGASSVYGSDAVAGVINVNLLTEFEGFRIQGTLAEPFETGGQQSRVSFVLGDVGERGSFVLGGEIEWRDGLGGCDRDWMESIRFDPQEPFHLETLCGPVDFVETDAGNFRRQRGDGGFNQQFISDVIQFPSNLFPDGNTEFGVFFPASELPVTGFGIGVPGTEFPLNGSVPDFQAFSFNPDDGIPGNFDDIFGASPLLRQSDQLIPTFQAQKLYLTADYDISDFIAGSEVFLEFNFSNRQSESLGNYEVIDAVLGSDNPFNVFTQNGVIINRADGNITTRPWQPWRDVNITELAQYRTIAGMRGDLGFLGDNGAIDFSAWDYELFAGYTRSIGFSQRQGIDEENLIRSLNAVVDPDTGNIVCADAPNPTAGFSPGEDLQPCVPFNPLDPGLWVRDGSVPTPSDPSTGFQAVDGDLIVDYLRTNRNVTTFVDQFIVGGYATGPAFTLPAGDLKTVVGFEFRRDRIDTRSSDVAENGGLSGFFRDLPTVGSVELFELFAEALVPIARDQFLIHNLELEAAGRYTEHEFYGSNFTYSGKVSYQPVEYVTLRGTVGTSFRAPNLRELFLAGQTSFGAINDPCQVPFALTDDTDGDGFADTYDPTQDPEGDTRVGTPIIDNCISEGVDPFSLGIGVNIGNIEQANAGNTGLDPEESFAFSGGVVFDQPWVDWIDVRLGLTYWDITVDNAVLTPSGQLVVNECYNSENFSSPFCQRRSRDPNTGFFQLIDITPFNIAEDAARGIDFNTFVGGEVDVFGEVVDLSFNGVMTYLAENSETLALPGSESITEDEAGDLNNPRWRGIYTIRADWQNWSLFWQTQFIGESAAIEAGNFNDRPANCWDPATGLDVERCYTIERYFNHTASLGYNNGQWNLRAGVQNVFDVNPPQIDEDVGGVSLNSRSVPIGVGYDLFGRTAFLNLSYTF